MSYGKVVLMGWLSLTIAVGASSIDESGFKPVFDGKTLNGWQVRGGASTYKVEDGAIVGCFGDNRYNTFLCTDKQYGDFILRFDFLLEAGNSGVQFRSDARPIKDNMERVFGYQAEMSLDPTTVARIYDEGRRGHRFDRVWLDSTPNEVIKVAAASYRKREWNSMEIQCVGPSIRTWLNGIPVVNYFDDAALSGFLGLQVHATKNADGSVCARWRNIRIKELGTSAWYPFFVKDENNKMSLRDARFVLPDDWSFNNEAGYLEGTHQSGEKRDGLVVTDNVYHDFIARVTYRFFSGNSALYFRAEEVDTPWLLKGFQNEISSKNKDSALWHTRGKTTRGRGWVATNDTFVAQVKVPDGWNTTTTVAYGDRIMSILNGQRTVDIIDPLCEKSGKLGLQLHGGTGCKMWFKDFEVLEITPEMRKLIDR